MAEAVIIGGGVSGLTTAFYLKQSGIRSTLLEKSNRLGGLIRTDVIQGCQLEAGPDSCIAIKPAFTELAAELGELKSQIIGSNDSERRVYIVRNGQFVDMPKGMSMMVPGDLKAAFESPLFSARTKIGFLAEVFHPKQQRGGDISVQELVVSHFGDEVLEYVTEPLLSGVYGGDSAKLSASSVLPRFVGYERDYGSLIRGVRREKAAPGYSGSLFLSFRSGMQSLVDALASAIQNEVEVVHQQATSIKRQGAGWLVVAATREIEATHVVIATPAYEAARLLRDSAAGLSSELAGIPYSSAILVTLIYRHEHATIPKGFGFLVPRCERQTVAAATFVGTKWPERLPADLVALRAFIVDPESQKLMALSNDDLRALVQVDFQKLLGIDAEPAFSTIERWPDSMPQYFVGHAARRKRIAAQLSEITGLHIIGNAYDGVGVPDAVRLAREAAHTIAALARKAPF